jgi:YHS domain-containing protein
MTDNAKHGHTHAPQGSGDATCPVCRMELELDSDTLSMEYEGETIWFCNEDCRDEFTADPAAFVAS